MAANKFYIAVGEEATRGTAESSTVGFVPVTSAAVPAFEPDDVRKQEYRGEEAALGDIGTRRMSTKWSYALEQNLFSEAGTTAGITGTILKHFFGKAVSTQNASTGQYFHQMYPVHNPTNAANLSTKALTINTNYSEGDTVKNHAYEGGLVTGLVFSQEPGQLLKVTANMVGQKKVASGTAIATPTYAAENLRFDYADLTMYTGTITRTGTGPNYTDYAFGSATQVIVDNYTLTLESAKTDNLVLAGVDYPTKDRLGKFKVTLQITLDFADPAAGFNSVDQVNNFLGGIATTNFFMHYDTGTQAGSGDNHSLYLDCPVMTNKGGPPEFTLDTDPMVTLTYEGDFDTATTSYIIGLMLKNTATAV